MAQVKPNSILVEMRHLDGRTPATDRETERAHDLLREMFLGGHGFGHIPDYTMLSRDALRHMAQGEPMLPYSVGFCKAVLDEARKMQLIEEAK